MVITVPELESVLGDILGKATTSDIKDVIGKFDQLSSIDKNIKALLTFQREPLSETYKFLKSLGTDFPAQAANLNSNSRTKQDFARDIITFIDFLKPTQCLMCSENYVPTITDYQLEKSRCYICRRPCHSDCYAENNVDPDKGVFFVCSECLSIKAATELQSSLQHLHHQEPTIQDPNDKKTEEPAPPKTAPMHEEARTYIEPTHDVEDCPLYLKRICPHGLTGKRLIEGEPCPHRHRKLCKYFAATGPDGCRFRNNCRFFHPTPCENSLKLQACYNKSCTNFHFSGTQRKAPASNEAGSYHQIPHRDMRNRPQRQNAIPPWETENSSANEVSTAPQISHETNEMPNAFLVKCLHDIKEELKAYSSTVIKETVKLHLPQVMQFQHHNFLQKPQPQSFVDSRYLLPMGSQIQDQPVIQENQQQNAQQYQWNNYAQQFPHVTVQTQPM